MEISLKKTNKNFLQNSLQIYQGYYIFPTWKV